MNIVYLFYSISFATISGNEYNLTILEVTKMIVEHEFTVVWKNETQEKIWGRNILDALNKKGYGVTEIRNMETYIPTSGPPIVKKGKPNRFKN